MTQMLALMSYTCTHSCVFHTTTFFIYSLNAYASLCLVPLFVIRVVGWGHCSRGCVVHTLRPDLVNPPYS